MTAKRDQFRLRRKNKLGVWLGVVLTVVLTMSGWIPFTQPILRKLELNSIDWRFQVRGERKPSDEIVIVALDEKSVSEVGRWPWSRGKMAEFVDRLAAAKCKVIAFDVLFPEAEEASPELARLRALVSAPAPKSEWTPAERARMAAMLDQVAVRGGGDHAFAEAISRAGNVVLAGYGRTVLPGERLETRTQALRGAEYGFVSGGAEVQEYLVNFPPASWDYVLSPIPELASAAAAIGLINYVSVADAHRPGYEDACDRDGVIRRVPLAMRLGTNNEVLYAPMFVQILRLYFDLEPHQVKLAWGDTVRLGDRAAIPMSTWGDMYVDWPYVESGGVASSGFRQVSASDVLSGRVGEAELAGKIAMIGATAAGLYDLRVTPFNPSAPGIEAHAAALDTVLQGRYLQQPVWVEMGVFLLGLILGVTLAIVLPRVGAAVAVTVTFVATGAWLITTEGLFLRGLLVPAVLPALILLAVPVTLMAYKFLGEQSEKFRIRETFGRYVSPKVVDKILADPEALKLGGHRGDVTILFSDIRGFTSISEKMEPEILVSTLNEYLTAMTDIVDNHEGTVDKFIGDAVMALWGAPLPHPDDAMRAVRTALAMQAEVLRLQKKWEAEGRPVFRIGIGINTGSAVVGNIGSPRKMDYTVIGDNVNLASRLESLNKEFATTIIISQFTYDRVAELVEVRRLGETKVKGKDRPVEIYEVLGLKGSAGATAA